MHMPHIIKTTVAAVLLAAATTTAAQNYSVHHSGDTVVAELALQTISVRTSLDTTIVEIANPRKYLLLPIQDDSPKTRVKVCTGSPDDRWIDVRLARTRTDGTVPIALGDSTQATVKIIGIKPKDLAMTSLATTDMWIADNTDYYRPIYHHTPPYGWMNAPSGLLLKDDEYHLYYQYNPYGPTWGNMHWGHAVSRDLVHWAELPPAIEPDNNGEIFSGSTVVDSENTAGFGAGAVIAIYTSASRKGQSQCLAYSHDNGRTFTKYEGNPVLQATDGSRDFRDPRVFRYEPAKAWFMILAAGTEMRFYKSDDLKQWDYVSSFGQGLAPEQGLYECPEIVRLPVDGDTTDMKYVLITNINQGGPSGGSATQYFVGDFDGRQFTCADDTITKWLDYGKDHYAAACFANAGHRAVAMPWMSNWQYASLTPTRQHRGANALPRELSIYTVGRHHYVASTVVDETRQMRRKRRRMDNVAIEGSTDMPRIARRSKGAFEFVADITPGEASTTGIELYNDKGERTVIYLDMENMRAVTDRTESGLTGFALKAGRDDKGETNDFATSTWAPLDLCEGKTYNVDIFVDMCSVELFIDGGRISMTNLVFPTKPYDSVRLFCNGGKASFDNMSLYDLRP